MTARGVTLSDSRQSSSRRCLIASANLRSRPGAWPSSASEGVPRQARPAYGAATARRLAQKPHVQRADCRLAAKASAYARYWVAARARSRTPAVAPTYMSRVTRTLAWPAMQETSVGSRYQLNRAVVQNTCRRLCQVQVPLRSASRHPAAW
jgi:hypothetical protein